MVEILVCGLAVAAVQDHAAHMSCVVAGGSDYSQSAGVKFQRNNGRPSNTTSILLTGHDNF